VSLTFDFDENKNKTLKLERGISFEEIIALIHEGLVVDVVQHPNRQRYPHQHIYVVDVTGYIYLVPFVRNKKCIFLKTIYPSRKATREYIKENA
jgi:uncharacterized DUF497 family protein